MTDQFKNDQLDESREKEYIAAAFEQHYADQLDKDLQKYGIYRERPAFRIRYLRPLLAVAASVALLVFGWTSYKTSNPDVQTLADGYIADISHDYGGEVRKGTASGNDDDEWSRIMELFKSGDYIGARRQIQQLPPAGVEETPEKRDFYTGLCALLQETPDLSEAASRLTKARGKAKDPRDCDWLLTLIYIKMDKKAEAATALSRLEQSGGSFRRKDVERLKKMVDGGR